MTKLLIGADPEVFVRNHEGAYISGHLFECGTKERPMAVTNGAFVQVDGMALEFNVPPSETKAAFVNSTIRVIRDLQGIVRAKHPGNSLSAIPVCDFGSDYIQTVPKENALLGCNPDFNAYTGEENPIPDAQLPFRTGSGHVHIGWTEGADPHDPDHFMNCRDIVRELDYYLGLPSLLWDQDNRRRELYGKAGAFRPKPYGVEYRVLSNAWLKSRDLMEFVFDRAQAATVAVFNGESRRLLQKKFGVLAQEIINSPDKTIREGWPVNHQKVAHFVLDDRRVQHA